MKQLFVNMLNLQHKMNLKVHPEWRAQGYPWHRAIWTECAELMDHHGWKWWKKQRPDKAQIQLEIVDIWHFGMSSLLQDEQETEKLSELILEQWNATPAQSAGDFLRAVEALAADTLTNKSFSIPLFCQLMTFADYTAEQLHRDYIGKNVLNFFRQDHGYKEGHYQKSWQGKEDNEHLAEILNLLDSEIEDYDKAIYQALKKRYP